MRRRPASVRPSSALGLVHTGCITEGVDAGAPTAAVRVCSSLIRRAAASITASASSRYSRSATASSQTPACNVATSSSRPTEAAPHARHKRVRAPGTRAKTKKCQQLLRWVQCYESLLVSMSLEHQRPFPILSSALVINGIPALYIPKHNYPYILIRRRPACATSSF